MEISSRYTQPRKFRKETDISFGDLLHHGKSVRKITEDVLKRDLLETLFDSIEYGQTYAIQITKETETSPVGSEIIRLNLEMAKLEVANDEQKEEV